VTLIEPPPAADSPPAADPSMRKPSTSPEASSGSVSAQQKIGQTISEVATAHAELDHVLPPTAPPASTPPPPEPEVAATPERVSDTPVAGGAEGAPDPEEQGGPRPTDPPIAAAEVDAAVVIEAPPPRRTVAIKDAVRAEPASPSPPSTDDPVTADSIEEPAREPQSASGNPLPRVLAVANQKGGVGKTTTSVNLGAALAELGFRVLVIDLDPQGNATTGLGIDARNFELSMYDVLMRDSSLEDCVEPTSMKNLFVAPATIALAGAEIELVPAFSRELKLKKSIESIIDDFDYVLIDCPPSLGLITVNALAAADEVLVPIQCEYYALEGLSQLMRNVHLVASNLNPKLDISTIVLTMYDARTKLADQVANEVRLHFGAKVCRNVIPRTVRLSEAPSFGQPITAFDPASRGAIAYRELAKEVSGGTT
jgi:chromosome partitioning protein